MSSPGGGTPAVSPDLTALLQFAGFLLLLILPGPFFRGIFFVVSVVIITVFEATLGNYSENLLINEILITAFGFIFALMGFTQYFPGFYYLIFPVAFAAFMLMSRSFYESTPHPEQIKWLNALIIGLVSSQVFWAVSFLPFHFSAMAILALNFFYLALVLNYYYLFQILSSKKIKYYLMLSGITILLVFSSTPWNIIN